MNRVELVIASEDSGKKLHRFLRQSLPGMPLSGIYRMIRVGRVKINGKKGKLNSLLAAGDQLVLFMSPEDYQALKKEPPKFLGVSKDLSILYEDDALLVVNKPSGLLTHPDGKEQKDTLVNRVLSYLHHKGELTSMRTFLPAPVNRLDRNTSGIVLFGKDQSSLRILTGEIRERRVKKTYLGIVWGKWHGEGEISARLEKQSDAGAVRVQVHEHEGGLAALTRYKVLGSGAAHSLVQLELVSGRTHQLRVHLQSVGHPLVGDVKYGGEPGLGVRHQLLHALTLELPGGQHWQAPPSEEFMMALRQAGLDRYWPVDERPTS